LALRAQNIHLRPMDTDGNPASIEEFTAALRERMQSSELYSELVGGVQFLSRSLFRATLHLAPNVPVGTHRARAFLFRNGIFVKETSAALNIRKAGVEQRIYEFAHQESLIYGVLSVLLAMLTGWLGRLVFRRDCRALHGACHTLVIPEAAKRLSGTQQRHRLAGSRLSLRRDDVGGSCLTPAAACRPQWD